LLQFYSNDLKFSAWLEDDDSPVVARLTRLIGAVTNLDMETAEALQVDILLFDII